MTRLRLSLKNTVKPAFLLNLAIFIIVSLSGCLGPVEPTYKEEDIPSIVKKICKDEYNLDVITKRTASTLWIYAPLSKLLHQDYGIKEDKVFDEEMIDKLRNILNTIGRVLISADKTPEFFALLASDINLGLDYTIIENVTDMKKSYAGFIPWTEANRRYVFRFKIAPEAIKDKTGVHLEAYDIKLADFLAEQIAQRIFGQFQEGDLKKYFKVNKSEGRFMDNTFIFEYSIEQVSQPEKKINIIKEILNTVPYCIKTYEFRDFKDVAIKDLITQDKLVLNQAEIWVRPIK